MTANLNAVIAANRFGLGAKPGELARAKSDPRGWLGDQVKGNRAVPEVIAKLPTSADVFKKYTDAEEARREARQQASSANNSEAALAQRIIQGVRQVLVPMYMDQVAARYTIAAHTDEPFREHLLHFWTNHFAVSADKVVVLGLAGALENEAIRPNLSNRFVDMLLAVEQHPAMILYLDNQQSSGPNSQLARLAERRAVRRDETKERKIGINENLAREIMELHTLGVNGGYTQTDVTTFAQALTGWSVGGGRGRLAQGDPGKFIFRDALHEPGAKTILGKRYTEEGRAQARTVLEDLAKHPSTAQFIATKLVRHFIDDDPPAAAVEKIAKVFRDTDGDLPSVHRAVIESSQAWQEPFAKFKTPHEFVVSAFRAVDFVPQQPNQVAAPFELLGQRPYSPGSPAGWPDTASQWDGSDALMKRIEWSTAVGQRIGSRVEPLKLADSTLGEALGDHTRTAISRAASAAQGLTLLLVSPEFQRR
ncbi:MAG TPA: DUF1800 domain-containing protein [Steroidobacteraceae bacterium]|nr:DUF1800 domain-containing protein [Steroidobacteraceae bacterium]